jgi:peptide/nickel transport system permease protein
MEQPVAHPAPRPGTTSPEQPRQSGVAASLREALMVLAGFAGRRLAFGLSVLLAITYLTFYGMGVLNGADWPDAFGPAGRQTLSYITGALTGDLGLTQPGSVAFRTLPVSEVLADVLPRSLGLLGAAFLVAIAIGVPLGVWAAVRRRKKPALLIILASIAGISTPSFFAALFLQIAAIQYTRAFGQSIVPVGGFGWDLHLVLPTLVLAARPVAQITRITFIALSEAHGQDYVRTAHSKGLRNDHILVVHMLRNAAVPILTTIALSLRFSLSSLPVVEVYFGWGGVGQTLLRALFNQDSNLIVTLLLSLGLLFILVEFALDFAYYLIDPRLKGEAQRASRRDREGFGSLLLSIPGEIRHFLLTNPASEWVREWVAPRKGQTSPFRSLLDDHQAPKDADPEKGEVSRWRTWKRGLAGNVALLLGGILVAGLIALVLFGPRLAPYSPNTTQQIAIIDGTLTTAPFPPSEAHPWGTDPLGRDMLSLILAGAQQTLILAFMVVLVRIVIGFTLGALAGWFHESWFDQTVMVLTHALAVFPTLLLAALLIFTLGIQEGMRTFILALSLVGWGEIAQFVRGEVIAIRPKPFIESAVAVGQRSARLILIHVVPNLAPAMIAVSALEVGAVLLILGELGFLGIFISGGASSDFGLYAQVPEWGALLSGVRTWTRSYPWTGFYPTAAFFIAVLAFNLLGEGIRQVVDEVGLMMNRLINRYTIGFAALLVGAFLWSRGNTGELVFYRQGSRVFDGDRAMGHISALTAPEMDGRALDSVGHLEAADYIKDQFQRLGLQPAGEDSTFFQATSRTYLTLDSEPTFTIGDGEGAPVYRDDFSLYPTGTRALGAADGPIHVLALGQEASMEGMDISGDVVLLLTEEDLPRLAAVDCQGVLVLAPDQNAIKRRHTLSPLPAQPGCGLDTPVFWVSEKLANRLLQQTGESIFSLNEQKESLKGQERLVFKAPTRVSIQVRGTIQEDVPTVNVLGQLPGTSQDLDSDMILVAAQYDSPPKGVDDPLPGANENASGIALMIEALRTLQDSGYQPYKTILFVAYSGEGLPELAPAPDAESYLQAKTGFADSFNIEAVIYLRGMGIGQADTLGVWIQEQSDLAKLVETASHLSGMSTERLNAHPSMNVFVPQASTQFQDAPPSVGLSRLGWERSARLPSDTATFIQSGELEDAGEAVSLTLMILGREINY